jgi:hypothetical protein
MHRVNHLTGTPGGRNVPNLMSAVTAMDDGRDGVGGGKGINGFEIGSLDTLELKTDEHKLTTSATWGARQARPRSGAAGRRAGLLMQSPSTSCQSQCGFLVASVRHPEVALATAGGGTDAGKVTRLEEVSNRVGHR